MTSEHRILSITPAAPGYRLAFPKSEQRDEQVHPIIVWALVRYAEPDGSEAIEPAYSDGGYVKIEMLGFDTTGVAIIHPGFNPEFEYEEGATPSVRAVPAKSTHQARQGV